MKEGSVRRNFIMNALLALSGVIFPLISFRYASRILMPSGIGKVSLATSVIAYFTMFSQLGISTYGIRICAQARDDRAALSRAVHELLGINLAAGGIAYAMLAVALAVVPKFAEERTLYILISSNILLNAIGMEWLYKGLEQYTYITARSIAFKIIALGAMFLLIHREEDYVIYGGITIFAASASNIMNFAHAGKFIDMRRPKGCEWKRHLKPVLVFFAMSCAATVYTNLDTLMLGFMTGDADVGFYNAAVKVKTILVYVVTALGAVLLPRSSWYVEQGRMEDFRRMTRKALRFILLTASAFTAFFICGAEECILFLSGEAFRPAVPAMRIIMPTLLLIGLTNIMGMQTLVPLGREKAVLQSEIAGAVTDLALNLILIPRWQAAGAAAGTLAAEAVVLGVQGFALRKEIGDFFREYNWGRLLAGLAIGTGICLGIRAAVGGTVVRLICSAAGFFAGYGLFMLGLREEPLTETLEQIRNKIRKKKNG